MSKEEQAKKQRREARKAKQVAHWDVSREAFIGAAFAADLARVGFFPMAKRAAW